MIEIPGYTTETELGRGGMATVYRAVQESVERQVALKVMSPVLLVDQTFSERFIREAKIAANLNHPHIVAVHDVGVHEDYHYIAMEYLVGGDLASTPRNSMDLAFVIRVMRDMASALHYAHGKGFVHRDVKPENILFREDGSSVLTDFGIARAVNSATQMTKTGAVIGTPHYMSPEQARGRELDGRSDLYALGIVFYEMLTGKVPYQGDDSVSVGIQHVTEPVPRLPQKLKHIQPVLERFLAKTPEKRYQNGGEALLDLQALEQQIISEQVPRVTPTGLSNRATALSDPGETMPLPTPTPEQMASAQSPVASSQVEAKQSPEQTPAPADQQHQSSQPQPRGARADGMKREPTLGDLHDFERINTPMTRSDAPGNRTTTQRDRKGGGGGRWIAVLLLLIAVGGIGWWQQDQWLPQAKSWLQSGGSSQNQASIETRIQKLLAQAEEAQAQGNLVGADNAASTRYQAVLELDSDNVRALAGLESIGLELVQEAEDALAEDRRARTWELIEQAEQVAPHLSRIQALKNRLSRQDIDVPSVADTTATRVRELMQEAQTLLDSDAVTSPPGANALAKYQSVLALDAGNQQAQAGIEQIRKLLWERARLAISTNNFAQAEADLGALSAVEKDVSALNELRADIAAAREQTSTAARLARERQMQLDSLLNQAKSAVSAGRLSAPPTDNALRSYNAVLRIDPNNAEAKQGLEDVANRLMRQVFADLEEDALDDAAARIDAVSAYYPSHAELAKARERLQLYRQQRARLASTRVDQDELAQRLVEAQDAMDQGNYMAPPGRSAYDLFKAVLRGNPNSEAARKGLARLSLELSSIAERELAEQQLERAKAHYQDAVQSDPSNPKLEFLRTQLALGFRQAVKDQIADGDADLAEQYLLQASGLDPTHPELGDLQRQLQLMSEGASG